MIDTQNSNEKHQRYFRIAGITIGIESDLDFNEFEFGHELKAFRVSGPGDDNVLIRHVFDVPDLKGKDFGHVIYNKVPWLISQKNGTWYYRAISQSEPDKTLQYGSFTNDHSQATIYTSPSVASSLTSNGWHSLSLFPTDQIWLTPLLAQRRAILLHSSAILLNGMALLFIGHSTAGKSTIVTMLKEASQNGRIAQTTEILCDDRNVVRKWDDGWRVHGTWSHGSVSEVSPSSGLLKAVLFLRQEKENRLVPLKDPMDIYGKLLSTTIKALTTREWWQKEMDLLAELIREIPFYTVNFDLSGDIVDSLAKLVTE